MYRVHRLLLDNTWYSSGNSNESDKSIFVSMTNAAITIKSVVSKLGRHRTTKQRIAKRNTSREGQAEHGNWSHDVTLAESDRALGHARGEMRDVTWQRSCEDRDEKWEGFVSCNELMRFPMSGSVPVKPRLPSRRGRNYAHKGRVSWLDEEIKLTWLKPARGKSDWKIESNWVSMWAILNREICPGFKIIALDMTMMQSSRL
jgi:hypothetical protein